MQAELSVFGSSVQKDAQEVAHKTADVVEHLPDKVGAQRARPRDQTMNLTACILCRPVRPRRCLRPL